MKKIKRALSLVLVFCMLCTMTVTGFAADTTSEGQTDFMKIVHLDAGRKYFSVDSIKKIIDNASADGYNYLELAVGNDGLRFLLDDMSVTVDDKTYDSSAVSQAIHAGNEAYYNFDTDELTQTEMDTIIAYANEKGISIIPLINSPGHMDAILSAATSLTGTTCSYNGSARTIDVTNDTAVAFTQALIQKYVTYFANKGCKYFNMGADEYANDVSNGFAELTSGEGYKSFVTYVNDMAKIIENANMTPMAFNDGIYYNYTDNAGTFDTNILVSYWTSGYSGYAPASASYLAGKDFKILNTNDAWYYVLGNGNSAYNLSHAQNGVQNTKYNDVPGDNDPTPVGSMICVWCDTPSASYSSTEEENIADLMKTFATSNPEVFTVSNSGESSDSSSNAKPNKAPAADTTEATAKTVTVPVGGTATETVSGDQTGNVNTDGLDTSIATVSAEYKSGSASTLKEVTSIESGKQYLIVNNRNGKLLTNTTAKYNNNNGLKLDGTASTDSTNLWTITGSGSSYTVKDTNSQYLTIGNSKASVSSDSVTLSLGYDNSGYWTISQTVSNRGSYTTYYLNNLGVGTTAGGYTSIDAGSKWTLYEIASETQDATTLTFTGVAAGTTTVQVGNTTYTINVVEKAPDDALTSSSIKLEYWITNRQVTANNATSKTISMSTDGITTEAGVDISSLAPSEAYNSEIGKTLYYWQTMRLDSSHEQTDGDKVDRTANGTTLTHIRNLNGAWQYQTSDGTWNYFQSDDQLVAYYLQKTDVTKEITTYAKDWGYSTSGTTNDTSDGKGQVALTVAVVYEDSTVSPTESKMYSSSTTIFNYWDDRDIGIVAPTNNSDYEISKITVTDGTRNNNKSANVWYTGDSITWEKTTNDAGSEWYNETTVWDESSGTTPMVNGAKGTSTEDGIIWSAKNTAKLVLIYLKPVQKETNLNVVYWDDNDNKAINANPFQIAMKYQQGDAEPSFVNDLKQSSKVNTGTFTLDDDAYVTNSSGVNQTFNKDLSIVQGRHTDEIDPKYGSGLYQYVSADISENGKTLTLHYNLKPNALTKNYVVDFGKSVEVPITDLIQKDDSVSKVEVSSNAKVNSDNSIKYTPSKILTGTDLVKVTVTYTTGSSQKFDIGFTPASNVMYEENFVKLGDDSSWTTTGKAGTENQKTEVLGKEGIHGYDKSYDADTAFSNGSAYQAQLTIPSGEDFTETDKTTFTFTGTGFDLISECGTNTGMLLAVVKDANQKPIKSYLVDTYFTGDTGDDETESIISGTGILDYQVPVVRCMGLDQATYTVDVYGYLTSGSGAVKNAAESAEATTEEGEVSVAAVEEVLDDMSVQNVEASEVEATCMDDNSVLLGGTGAEATTTSTKSKARAAAAKTTSTTASVYIDGVRVYNTLNGSNGAQDYTDSEKNVKYESVYDYVKNSLDANGSWTDNAMIYTEYNGSTDISSIAEYKQQGPENEVYLAPGCDIAFALKNYKVGNTVQIAMKAVNDSVTVNIQGEDSDTSMLESATEMYYELTPKYDEELDAYVVKIGNDRESGGVLSLSSLKLSSNVTVSSNQELANKIIEEDNTKPTFTPKTFTVSVPADTLKVGKSSVIKVKASTDVEYVYMKVDDEDQTELNANNKNAVANGKTDLYSYSKTIKTKGKGKLSEGKYKYSIWAVDENGNQSKSVDFTVTITE